MKKGFLLGLLGLAVLSQTACRKDKNAKVLECREYTETLVLENHNEGGVDYIVNCELIIKGNLSIQPGTTIQFGDEGGIAVVDNGVISAVGTAENPVILQGNSNTQANWKFLGIFSFGDNRLSNVQIRGGGRAALSYYFCDYGALTINGRAAVNNCLIDRSGSNGIYFGNCTVTGEAQLTSFSHNTISNSRAFPIRSLDKHLKQFSYTGCNFLNNAFEAVAFVANNSNRSIEGIHTWKNPGIPYESIDGFYIDGSTSRLTIEAGTQILMANETACGASNAATLRLEGTAQSPIFIRGLNETAGSWRGIMISSESPDNLLRHVNVADGGGGDSPAYYGNVKANIYVGVWFPGKLALENVNSQRSNSTCDVAVGRGGANYITVSGGTLNTCED